MKDFESIVVHFSTFPLLYQICITDYLIRYLVLYIEMPVRE